MKKIIVWLAVMMYTLSGYAQNAPWNFQSKVVTDTLFSKFKACLYRFSAKEF